jgi:hypothetical protein
VLHGLIQRDAGNGAQFRRALHGLGLWFEFRALNMQLDLLPPGP